MTTRKVSPEIQAHDQGRQHALIKRDNRNGNYVGSIRVCSSGVVRRVAPISLVGLLLLHSGELFAREAEPEIAPEIQLIPETSAEPPVEPNPTPAELIRSSDVPLRTASEETQIASAGEPEVDGIPEVETESGVTTTVEPARSGPAFRGSPVPGDTALMRVLDRSTAAIARGAFTPAFRGGLVDARPFSGPGGIHFGPLALDATLSLGVFAEQGSGSGEEGDESWQMLFRASPSITGTVGYPESGRFLTFDYATSLQFGGQEDQGGGMDHAVSLDGYYGFAKLKLQLGADYSFSTGVDRDIGGSTDRGLFGISFNALYPLSLKSVLQGTVAANSSSYAEGISSDQLQGSLFLDRQTTLKTRLGLGATFGAVQVDAGEDQTFEQIQLRVTYLPTPKLSANATAGYEFRQTGWGNTATPIVSGGLDYQVRTTTAVQVGVERSVNSSAAERNTNFTSTTFTFAVSQKVGQRVHGSLAVGYQIATYESSGATDPELADREDHFFFVRPNVTWQVAERLSLSLFYSFGKNESTDRAFNTQQLGLNGTVIF